MDAADAWDVVMGRIDRDERLLWAGAPSAGAAARAALPAALLGIPFVGVALSGIGAPAGPGPQRWLALPLALVGAVMLLAPLWARWRARGTFYGVTDRRTVIVRGAPTGPIVSIDHAGIEELVCHERRDGSGTLVLHAQSLDPGAGHAGGGRPALVGIPEIRRVEGILQECLRTRLERRAA